MRNQHKTSPKHDESSDGSSLKFVAQKHTGALFSTRQPYSQFLLNAPQGSTVTSVRK